MIDYHTHTWRCGHAEGTPWDYVQKAQEKGLSEIGISDHYPMDILGLPGYEGCSMPYRALTAYVAEVRSLQQNYDILPTVRLGVEMDYIENQEETMRALLGDFDWDYVIGSVHFLHDIDISHPDNIAYFHRQPALDVMQSYFNVVKKMIASELFDIVGHIDVIKKFGYPGNGSLPGSELQDMYREIARLCRDKNQVVEVNTAGLRSSVGEIYPSPALLSEMVHYQVPVTLGSDAHNPSEVGYEYAPAVNRLKSMGVKSIIGFENREPYEIGLEV